MKIAVNPRLLRPGEPDVTLWWTIEQTLVNRFQPTDRIGWSSVLEDAPLGVIVISEADPELGWHLGWYTDDPSVTYHWRGSATMRDTRWHIEPVHVIELP